MVISQNFQFLQEFIASTQAGILGLESLGNLVLVNGNSFQIVSSCTGLVSGSVLAAIIFSLRKPRLKLKAIIFAAGFGGLLVLNYFRVLMVLWSAREFGVDIAGAVHVVSWFATVAFVLFLWYHITKQVTGARDFSGFL